MPPYIYPSHRSAVIAHALSHPVRIEILNLLVEGKLSVGDITERLARPQANISQHLARLREVHLVTATRTGMGVEYSISVPIIEELLSLMSQIAARIPADEFIPRGRGRRRGGRGRGREWHK